MRGMSSTLFFLALIFDRVQQVFAGKAAINSVSARSSGCWLMPISQRRTISCPLKACISQVLYKVGPGGSGWDSIRLPGPLRRGCVALPALVLPPDMLAGAGLGVCIHI